MMTPPDRIPGADARGVVEWHHAWIGSRWRRFDSVLPRITGNPLRRKISTVRHGPQSKISRLLNGKTIMGIDDADILSHGLGVDLREVLAEAMAETSDRLRKSTPDERLRSI
jgi:hypothetical protein